MLNDVLTVQPPKLIIAKWDSFAVIEEFFQLDPSYARGVDPHLIPHDEAHWGPSYFTYKVNIPKEGALKGEREDKIMVEHFVANILATARYAVPFIKNIDMLMKEKLKLKPYNLNSGLGTMT